MEYGTFSSRPRPARTHWLDNFRTYLTVLVIYHHTALAYGGSGGQLYKSKHHPPSKWMVMFNAVNQSYFMAAFFFVSGYFSSLSARRKSRIHLLKDRLIRLGIPVLLYPFLVQPLIHVSATAIMLRQPITFSIFTDHWKNIRGVEGPVWFCALLLIFDICYISLKPVLPSSTVTREGPDGTVETKTYSKTTRFVLILCGLIASATSSFIIRMFYPGLYLFVPLGLLIGYLPQYILYYSLGHMCPPPLLPSYLNPMHLVPFVFGTLIVAIITSSRVNAGIGNPQDAFNRGEPSVTACYVFVNEALGYTLFWTFLNCFHRWAKSELPWRLARYSYAAFLVHMLVSQTIEMALDGWLASAVVKLLVIGSINVVASWLVGMLLIQIPCVRRVIG